jgi:ribosomal protein S27AE
MKLDWCFYVSVLVEAGVKPLYLYKLNRFFMKKEKECPSCAMPVDKEAETCPICGYEFPKQPLSLKIGIWLLIALMLIWILF